MPKSLRVKLDPVSSASGTGGGARRVAGAALRLTRFGSGKSQVKRDVSVPAKVTLLARFFERIRDDAGTSPEPLASLQGTLSLARSSGEPVFRVDAGPPDAADASTPLEPEEPLEDPDEPAASSSPRRALTIAFDAGQFPGLGELELVLPAKAEEFTFVEIAAELEVAGAIEASIEQNDVLDVPLLRDAPTFFPAFEPRIVDEIGEPLSSLDVTFQIGELVRPKVTDEKGVARLFERKATVANLELPPPSELKTLLKARWDEVRGAARLLPTQTVQTLLVRDDMDTPIPVEVGVRTVISLQPRVERARLLRFFFDTNKTFILPDLPEATDTLRALYERNTPSKLLIVGHADTSGDAAFNDKLSLERAETLLAYLKDDVDGWLKWFGSDVPSKKRAGRRVPACRRVSQSRESVRPHRERRARSTRRNLASNASSSSTIPILMKTIATRPRDDGSTTSGIWIRRWSLT